MKTETTIDVKAKINKLMDRIESLTYLEIRINEWNGPFTEKSKKWNEIRSEMNLTRQEILHLLTK